MSEAVWATLPAPARNRSWTSPEHAAIAGSILPGPTDTHRWNDLRCFPSHGESDCVQAEGVTNDHLAKKPSEHCSF